MNLGGGACSEPRPGHCTPGWATEGDSISKKKKKRYTTNFCASTLYPETLLASFIKSRILLEEESLECSRRKIISSVSRDFDFLLFNMDAF